MHDVTLRPALSATVAVGWPWLFLSILFAVAAFVGHESLWIVAGICLAVLALTVIWVYSHKLEVRSNILSYTSLFGPKVSIGIGDIAAAETQIGPERYADRFLPTFRLKIVPSKDSGAAPFFINQKVFSKLDIQQLLEVIGG